MMPLMTYLHTLDPFAVKFTESFGIRWYGLSYLAGFFFGYLIIRWMCRKGLSPLRAEHAGDFVFNAAVGTIIGGRLGYCLLYSPDLFIRFTSTVPFWGVFAINEGGMASHGGILGVLIASILFARRHKISGLHLADLTTLGGSIGIFFGRIANFINGELVGRPAPENLAWGVKFPQDVLAWPTYEANRLLSLAPVVEPLGITQDKWSDLVTRFRFEGRAWQMLDHTLSQIVQAVQSGNQLIIDRLTPILTLRHPSQLYEALLEGLLLFFIMFFVWRKPQKPGVICGLFFSCYSLVRIFGEQFRMPDAQIGFGLWGLTRGQWLSFGLLALGLLIMIFCLKRAAPKYGGWRAINQS